MLHGVLNRLIPGETDISAETDEISGLMDSSVTRGVPQKDLGILLELLMKCLFPIVLALPKFIDFQFVS